MTFNLASKNILLSPNDKLSIPLPLPYNGSIYSEEDIKKFMESSIQKSRQPVIIFGGNWCPDCRILDGTLQIPTIQKFINDHYDVMHIDVGRYDKNMELMDFFGIVKEKEFQESWSLIKKIIYSIVLLPRNGLLQEKEAHKIYLIISKGWLCD
jgi:thiol-disulfide isomerase/thioredoxin